jgi:hypothetical protein
MPDLPSTLPDREFQKFTIDADGQTSVRIAPGAVTDTEGHELDIDEAGRAQMRDVKSQAELRSINDKLSDIIEILKSIAE